MEATPPEEPPQSNAGEPPEPPTEPTQPQPTGPRTLYRSRENRVIGGVLGGLANHLGIDAVILRIAAVVLLFVGGLGAIAYLAALALVPNEPLDGAPAPPPRTAGTPRAVTIGVIALVVVSAPLLLGTGLVIAAIGLPLLILTLIGLFTWWIVSGEVASGEPVDIARRAALGVGLLMLAAVLFAGGAWAAGVGGGTVVAGIVIAAGGALVAGAFAGGLRILIIPAFALALGVGLVAAADVDLTGGIGEREYSPSTASDIRGSYELGMGRLVVDLRSVELPKGDTPLSIRVGIGSAEIYVPSDVCVASTADIGIGHVGVFQRDSGGIDIGWKDRPRAGESGKRLVVDAEVGIGDLRVRHYSFREFREHGRTRGFDGPGRGLLEPPAAPPSPLATNRNDACARA